MSYPICLDLYTYANGDPINYFDPDGRFASPVYEPIKATVLSAWDSSLGWPASYRSTMGGDMKSALGGIVHGSMDFALDSIHSLSLGATYIGSEDLGLNLYERINLFGAVEHSQIQRSNAIGNHLMGMMGVNELDAFYHSFRSHTIWGLELGSLAFGGHGTVKGGAIGLSTWAKKIRQLNKLSKNVSPLLSNPLHGIKYSKKVLLQMEKNLTT